jgi:hypothetical protein
MNKSNNVINHAVQSKKNEKLMKERFANVVVAELDRLSANGGRDHDDEDSDAFCSIVRGWEILRRKRMGYR